LVKNRLAESSEIYQSIHQADVDEGSSISNIFAPLAVWLLLLRLARKCKPPAARLKIVHLNGM
jgi:hypothetical protein